MGNNIFSLEELDCFSREILELADKKLPKQTKKFVKKEGNKLKSATIKKAKAKTNKRTGKYYKGIKTGKIYKYSGNGGTSIRVYASKPPAYHANLIEYGHRIVQKSRVVKINGRYLTLKAYIRGETGGQEVGFVQGLHVFEESGKEFAPVFYGDIETFLDEVIKEI